MSSGVEDQDRARDRKVARARSSRRWAVTSIGVAVLLVGTIAVANQGGGEQDREPAATGGAPLTGFPHTKRGAESAASSYAAALGGEDMFNRAARHRLVQSVTAPAQREQLQRGFDQDYTAAFNKKLGLDADGHAPAGQTFVSKTRPAETIARAYGPTAATVEVWCSGHLGLTSKTSERDVSETWFTMTIELTWAEGDWKVRDLAQRSGPVP